MKLGTIVKMPDGQVATVVYHGLDGHGVIFGRHMNIRKIDISDTGFKDEIPAPQAMLRDPWPGAELPCLGSEFEIIDVPALEASP